MKALIIKNVILDSYYLEKGVNWWCGKGVLVDIKESLYLSIYLFYTSGDCGDTYISHFRPFRHLFSKHTSCGVLTDLKSNDESHSCILNYALQLQTSEKTPGHFEYFHFYAVRGPQCSAKPSPDQAKDSPDTY